MMGPLSFELPKYAQIVNAIQERIAAGKYPAGGSIPSEAQLSAEFGASRPVVVRALGILQQDGWIDSEQGRGRFVRHPKGRAVRQGGPGRDVLREDAEAVLAVLDVGVIDAPPGVAMALGLAQDTPVMARRRLVTTDIGPVELGSTYLPVTVAAGTSLAEVDPLGPGGVIEHLKVRKGIRFDYASERIGARPATAEEARLLDIARRECVLTVFVTAFDASGVALFVTDAVLPATRRDLEDEFPIG